MRREKVDKAEDRARIQVLRREKEEMCKPINAGLRTPQLLFCRLEGAGTKEGLTSCIVV